MLSAFARASILRQEAVIMRISRARVQYPDSAAVPTLLLALSFSLLAMLPFLGILFTDLAREFSYDSGNVRYVPTPNPPVRFVGF